MQNPNAVGDSDGEWFEVQNVSGGTLQLCNMHITDDDQSEDTVIDVPLLLADGEFAVFGHSTDTTVNGDIPVDAVFNGPLGNGSDSIFLRTADASVIIDTVAWDNGNTFPDPNGASMRLDDVTADNSVGANWSEAFTAIGNGDFGSPGTANPPRPDAVTVTIFELQDETEANHPDIGTPVNLVDVRVTAVNPARGHLFVQEVAGGPFSGLFVSTDADVSAVAVGDEVSITGAYSEGSGNSTSGLTLVNATEVTVTTAAAGALAPEVMTIAALISDAEQWEGVLVQIDGATVVTPPNNFNEFEISDDNGVSTILCDDLFFNGAPVANQVYSSVIGPLNFSFGNFKIVPRDAADLQ